MKRINGRLQFTAGAGLLETNRSVQDEIGERIVRLKRA